MSGSINIAPVRQGEPRVAEFALRSVSSPCVPRSRVSSRRDGNKRLSLRRPCRYFPEESATSAATAVSVRWGEASRSRRSHGRPEVRTALQPSTDTRRECLVPEISRRFTEDHWREQESRDYRNATPIAANFERKMHLRVAFSRKLGGLAERTSGAVNERPRRWRGRGRRNGRLEKALKGKQQRWTARREFLERAGTRQRDRHDGVCDFPISA